MHLKTDGLIIEDVLNRETGHLTCFLLFCAEKCRKCAVSQAETEMCACGIQVYCYLKK